MADLIESGTHGYTPEHYVPVTDPLLKQRLEWFKDQKLAFMMHFGPYVQLGLCESWPLSDGDAEWSRHQVDWTDDAEEFKRQYIDMAKTFNPVRYRPDRWAQLASDSGFKYLLLTTKHHDGFCMWDTKYSDYKITSPDCPFHTHKYADIIKYAFDAFRDRGMAIAAYFSKADWHSPYYWDNCGLGIKTTRNPSYDTAKDPERWEKFAQYTKNQIMELVENYGRIDIIWLDAGQVNRYNKQDIHIEDIIASARKVQPWIISADRTIGGICENYITPEQTVPPEPLAVPWESCITMGTAFSYRYDDKYKSVCELIQLLLDIIAKGGNLALNVSPQPDGALPEPAVERMKGMGAWLKLNGEGIYSTRPVTPFKADNFVFTQKPGVIYAYTMYNESFTALSESFSVPVAEAEFVKCVRHLATGRMLDFSFDCGKINVKLPSDIICSNVSDGFAFER